MGISPKPKLESFKGEGEENARSDSRRGGRNGPRSHPNG